MGTDFLNNEERIDWYDSVCERMDVDLKTLIADGPAEKLEDTKITQPAVFLINHLIYKYLRSTADFDPDYFAGHSLGEYNALVASGRAGFDELFPVVVTRGRAMGEAADRIRGGMAALLRIDAEAAETLCRDISDDPEIEGTVQVALYNSPDQLVISGAGNALEEAVDQARDAGALKAVELDVSGPWHSQYMKPAVEPLQAALEAFDWSDGKPVVTNVNADFLEGSPSDGLIKQLTQPVRWIQSIQRLLDDGVRTFVEIGPGDSLKGMIERIAKETEHDVNVLNTDTLDHTEEIIGDLNL
jgi:[acyl-carrier-protein] S-malonyltransferase